MQHMYKLIADLGNTLQKIALFRSSDMLEVKTIKGITREGFVRAAEELAALHCKGKKADAVILSSVIGISNDLREYLKGFDTSIILDHTTPLPLVNRYLTPETLGKDRLAAAVGAVAMYPSSDRLVVDAGTCITYDLINRHDEYLGGGISPGITMRYRALNHFTGQLPLLDRKEDAGLIGNDTGGSIHSGVIRGAKAEVRGIIREYRRRYPRCVVLVTGGDHGFFDKIIKNNIFAAPNLVLTGLNVILDFHVGKKV
jgi:type III pantothenate kinase